MHKTPSEMTLAERKVDLVTRLYLAPADEDYLTARWCYGSGTFHTFYWCAGQAFEKYLKAAILLNGGSTRKYQHDLVALFSDVQALDEDGIIPATLDLPETTAMGRDAWQGKPSTLYADYLRQYGSPDNRYAFYGTFVNGPVLHILDTLFFSLRKLIRIKNFSGFPGIPPTEEPWMISRDLMLERLYLRIYQVGEDERLRQVFSNMNLAFFHQREDGERTFGGQHFHGSALYNHLVQVREMDPSDGNRKIVDDLRDWASNNIFMSSSVRSQLGLPLKGRHPPNND